MSSIQRGMGLALGLLLLTAIPLAAQAEAELLRLVPSLSEIEVAVGESVPLSVEAFDADGNPVEDVELRFAAPRTGLHVRDGQVTGREVGRYAIHVSVIVPDGPRRVPASIYVENPPPGMPIGPAPALEIPVHVTWPGIETVEVTSPSESLHPGSRIRHRARALHADGTAREAEGVRWSSSDPQVAQVDVHGFVTALAPGEVAIEATVEGATGSVTRRVDPFPAEGLTLRTDVDEVRTGDVVHLHLQAWDSAGDEVAVPPAEWSYHHQPHDSIMARGAGAHVEEGVFVAEVPGVYTITAMAGDRVARATLEVHPRQVLHRAHLVGRGEVTHDRTRDFWVFEGLDGRDYAISGSSGFAYVWDVTDPGNMIRTDSIFVDARSVNDVKVSPDSRYAVLTREGASDRMNGVILLDLENPANPTIASEHTAELTGGVHNVWPENDYLYALSGGQRYVIIDVSDIYDPRVVGEYGHPNSSIHDVIVHNGIAYSSEWENGIVVVDVGNGQWGGTPEAPVFITQVRFPEMLTHTIWPYEEPSSGRFYLLASDELWPRVGSPLEGYADLLAFDPETGEGGRPAHTGGYVHIIDFTDPENAKKVARYQMDEYGTHNPWIEDGVLYQAYYEGGVRIMDISGELRGDLLAQGREMVVYKPYDPQGFIANAPMVWSVMPHKGHVFFSDANSGLWAIQIEPREHRAIF
jgi:hypothetical protein